MRQVKTPKSPEVKYRAQLTALSLRLSAGAKEFIIPLLLQLEPQYVNDAETFMDGYAATLEQAFDNFINQFKDLDTNARIVANSFTENVDQVNKNRFYSAMEDAIGINLQNIIQGEGLDNILTATTRENVALIKSIPAEYFKQIEGIVFNGTNQGATAGSMISQIVELGQSTNKRAKLIARDQTSKLNSAFNQQRQQNLGIEEYIWRTADDGRVRKSHAEKDDKVFRWDSPPKDTGHPGNDIQCRCVAQPIIKF